MTTPFWINDPLILINSNQITQVWPKPDMSRNEKLNSISRMIIILTIIGSLITQSFKLFFTGVITLAIIIVLHFVQLNSQNQNNIKEEFTQLNKTAFTMPTESNSLMNVQLTDYITNPNRLAAAPSYLKVMEEDINEKTKNFVTSQFNSETNIKDKLFSDLGDNYVFNQSMRNYYTTPNTTIPNDQNAFANYCYGDMISCKEGHPIACTRNNSRWTNY